jgi:hypothetical protein
MVMAGSGNIAGCSATEDLSMASHFRRNVQNFISGATEPKWNEFLSLIDQLVVCLIILSTAQSVLPTIELNSFS